MHILAYLVDSLIANRDKCTSQVNTRPVLQKLDQLGFRRKNPNPTRKPFQPLQYLGFVIDSRYGAYHTNIEGQDLRRETSQLFAKRNAPFDICYRSSTKHKR